MSQRSISHLEKLQFIITPAAILRDQTLNHYELRVMLAIYSFLDQTMSYCWPSRKTLSDIVGLKQDTNLSPILKRLEEKGWLKVERRDAAGKSSIYRPTIPSHLRPQQDADAPTWGSVTTDGGVCDDRPGGSVTADPGGMWPQTPFKRKEHNQENITNEQEEADPPLLEEMTIPKAKAKFDPKAIALPEEIPYKDWCEFVDYRREIKHPVTAIAARRLIHDLQALARQRQDISACIGQSISNGWRGVFATKPTTTSHHANRYSHLTDSRISVPSF